MGSDKDRTKSGAARNEVNARAPRLLSSTVVKWRPGLEHMITLFTDLAHDTNALAADLPLVPPLVHQNDIPDKCENYISKVCGLISLFPVAATS